MKTILIIVTQPRSAAHREHRLIALHFYPEQFNGSGAQVSCSCVCEVTRNRIQYRSQQNAILQTYENTFKYNTEIIKIIGNYNVTFIYLCLSKDWIVAATVPRNCSHLWHPSRRCTNFPRLQVELAYSWVPNNPKDPGK